MQQIFDTGTAFWASKTLLSAIELGVFTELGSDRMDCESLRLALDLHGRGAEDFFDALVALGFLERTEGKYSNTRETRVYLDRTKPLYIGDSFEMANSRLWDAWGKLTDALRTGSLQNENPAGEVFDTLYSDPELLARFLSAMTAASLGTAIAISRRFDWSAYRSFLDVGTAQGGVPVKLAKVHPHLRGIGFDRPAVQPHFERFVSAHGVADRVSFQSGDFFEDELPRADVVVMGHILHDWNLEQKLSLLRRAHAALPDGGVLMVYEALIDDERCVNTFGLLMSLNMLVDTVGGFNFSAADCIGWMTEVGFKDPRVEPLVGPDSLLIAVK